MANKDNTGKSRQTNSTKTGAVDKRTKGGKIMSGKYDSKKK
jgi:hypothetical protein